MYVCIYVCMYVCMYVFMYEWMYLCVCICRCDVCIYTYIVGYTCMLYACMYKWWTVIITFMYVCIYVCMHLACGLQQGGCQTLRQYLSFAKPRNSFSDISQEFTYIHTYIQIYILTLAISAITNWALATARPYPGTITTDFALFNALAAAVASMVEYASTTGMPLEVVKDSVLLDAVAETL